MKKFTMLLISFIFLIGGAWASDTTKVNLKGTNKVKHFKMTVDSTRAVVIKGAILESNMAAIKKSITELKEADVKKPIYIIINSPGGSVVDGFEVITLIKSISVPVYCAVESEAFSMAAIISQYCTKTYIHKYGAIMFHSASYGLDGSAEQINTRVQFMNNYLYVLESDLAKQMGISYNEYVNLKSKEWWLTAEQAVKFGVVDGILDELYYTAEPPKKEFSIFGLNFDEMDGNVVKHPLK